VGGGGYGFRMSNNSKLGARYSIRFVSVGLVAQSEMSATDTLEQRMAETPAATRVQDPNLISPDVLCYVFTSRKLCSVVVITVHLLYNL
jgi:hypothetical protein